MDFRCKTCGRWVWDSYHKCPPRFEVAIEDWTTKEEPDTVYAVNEEEAAEVAMKRVCEGSGDYPGGPTVAWTREEGETAWKKWEVEIDWEPNFSATEVRDEDS